MFHNAMLMSVSFPSNIRLIAPVEEGSWDRGRWLAWARQPPIWRRDREPRSGPCKAPYLGSNQIPPRPGGSLTRPDSRAAGEDDEDVGRARGVGGGGERAGEPLAGEHGGRDEVGDRVEPPRALGQEPGGAEQRGQLPAREAPEPPVAGVGRPD